jgi:hypothetical protein
MAFTDVPHIVLPGSPETLGFTSISQMGADKRIPSRNRDNHAIFLRNRLNQAWTESQNEIVASHASRHGVYLEFKGAPGYDLLTKSLEDMRSKKVRLCNVRTVSEPTINETTGTAEERNVIFATVFVSNDKRQAFFEKIDQYATKSNDSGKPKNADLINGIADLRKALLIESFWQDDRNLIPDEEPEWCEVWLSSDSADVILGFDRILVAQQICSKPGFIHFPERTVKLVFVSRVQLESLTRLSDHIAEYRRGKTTSAFWTQLASREQAGWTQDFAQRLQVDRDSLTSICILDTGINYGHPLLSPIVDASDCHTVDPGWGTHDHDGHGTLMAGISGYGNLSDILDGFGAIQIDHVLESVKILPNEGQNEPELWGDLTSRGISLAEIQAPDRKRITCMAVTAWDKRDRGRPSSWSGALDQITSGVGDDTKRIVIVSTGNADPALLVNYPEAQLTDSVHDPAQSWNALTVGAFTQLNNLTDSTFKNYTPLAKVNQLSPFSTTSTTWDDKWPIKPEIVMEGGNVAIDGTGFYTECDDLSLLSTHYQPQVHLLRSFNMTSAAASQAANFAAKIQARYPEYWPETIRALMVHSAEWPDSLKGQFAANDSKTEIKKLLRACGYGVPRLQQALYSASNSLTLISQEQIQPFEHRDGRNRTRDMHLYDLPWPIDVLLDHHDLPVEMRITLSYFIEPGPGEIGWKDRYRYASHGLRFDINSPGESKDNFVQRINAAARDEEEGHPGTSSASQHWVIGQARDKGSIHSDIWRGTAAELAASHHIGIYPRIGWWRERGHLGKCESSTRYALIVSISTPEQEVDIYTPVALQVGITAPVTISI